MKNRFYYLVLIVFMMSCQDDQDLKTSSTTIQVADGRLKFLDEDHFLETGLSLQRGNTDVIDGRVLGLDYLSYYSTLDDPKSSDGYQPLELYEYRLLLNHEREVQIGEKIYLVSNEDTRSFNLKGELLEVTQNEVSYYDRESKSFELNDRANAKAFGISYTETFPQELDGIAHGVRYKWIRSGAIIIFYYYETNYQRPFYPPVATVAEYFQREISDCEISSCYYQNNNPYGGIHYNVGTVKYTCGGNTRSHELSHGAFLRAVYWVKPYNKMARYVYHQDDLDIP